MAYAAILQVHHNPRKILLTEKGLSHALQLFVVVSIILDTMKGSGTNLSTTPPRGL
jgi:hypothetical protein